MVEKKVPNAANHIRELRDQRGWSLRELADRMGIHYTTVAKIERSQRRLTHEWATKFAEAFGVKIFQVASDYEGASFPLVARQHPVIGMVAAGNWREAVVETDDYIAAPVTGRNAFGLRVDGASMDRIAPEGAVVMVDPDQPDLHDGSLYVVMNDESEATFKQYRANPARLEPCSSDPTFKPIVLGQQPFTVVGKVVGVYQSFS